LNDVAARVNLSPSHFSVVFGKETGQNFKDYLIGVRIQKAKELLRSTALKSTDIGSLVGYQDPHYFSFVFKKNTGFSPSEFRLQRQSG
jgi:two-component system, response regulator YesN